jgi:hypothetical protein
MYKGFCCPVTLSRNQIAHGRIRDEFSDRSGQERPVMLVGYAREVDGQRGAQPGLANRVGQSPEHPSDPGHSSRVQAGTLADSSRQTLTLVAHADAARCCRCPRRACTATPGDRQEYDWLKVAVCLGRVAAMQDAPGNPEDEEAVGQEPDETGEVRH